MNYILNIVSGLFMFISSVMVGILGASHSQNPVAANTITPVTDPSIASTPTITSSFESWSLSTENSQCTGQLGIFDSRQWASSTPVMRSLSPLTNAFSDQQQLMIDGISFKMPTNEKTALTTPPQGTISYIHEDNIKTLAFEKNEGMSALKDWADVTTKACPNLHTEIFDWLANKTDLQIEMKILDLTPASTDSVSPELHETLLAAKEAMQPKKDIYETISGEWTFLQFGQATDGVRVDIFSQDGARIGDFLFPLDWRQSEIDYILNSIQAATTSGG